MSDAIITRRGGSGSGKSIARAQVELDFASVPYDGAQHAPKVTRVTLRGAELVEWQDYVALSTPATAAGEYRVAVMGIQDYSGVAEAPWTIAKAARTLTASPQSLTIQGAAGTTASVTLQYEGDGEISVSPSELVTAKVEGKSVTLTSVTEGSGSLTITLGEGTNWQEASCEVQVETRFITIYGVKYDGGPSTKWVRTDASALYPDPVAATPTIQGDSPFDGKKPWVFKDVIEDGNYFVRIDKFWIDVGMDGGNPYVRIADGPAEGFKPAPVFEDRDGTGERNYVLVGKYHCGDDYSSKPGVTPITNITCKQAVDRIALLGNGYVCWDEALLMTLWFLYIVEYADWDSQATVGFGCGATSSIAQTGATDSLDYPTGTSAATRETYGEVKLYGVEGVWSNVYFWLAGVRTASGDIYVSSNPADYSAMAGGTGGTLVGRVPASTGWMKAVKFSETVGFEWHLLTTKTGGSESTYMADYCYLDASSSSVVIFAGGSYDYHGRNRGILFQCNTGTSDGDASGDIGAHFYKLPPAAKP